MSPSDLLYALKHCPTPSSRRGFYNSCHKRDLLKSIEQDARALSREFTRQVIRSLAANGIWNPDIEHVLRQRLKLLGLNEPIASLIGSPSVTSPPAEPDMSAFFPPGDLPTPKTTSELVSLLSESERHTFEALQQNIVQHRAKGLKPLPEHVSPADYFRILRTRDTENEELLLNYYHYLHSRERFERWLGAKLAQLRAGRIRLEHVSVNPNLFFGIREPDAESDRLAAGASDALDLPAANNSIIIGIRSASVRTFERHRALNASRFGQPLVFNLEYAANMSSKETRFLADTLVDCISANESALPEPMHFVFAGLRPDTLLARRLVEKLNCPLGVADCYS